MYIQLTATRFQVPRSGPGKAVTADLALLQRWHTVPSHQVAHERPAALWNQ